MLYLWKEGDEKEQVWRIVIMLSLFRMFMRVKYNVNFKLPHLIATQCTLFLTTIMWVPSNRMFKLRKQDGARHNTIPLVIIWLLSSIRAIYNFGHIQNVRPCAQTLNTVNIIIIHSTNNITLRLLRSILHINLFFMVLLGASSLPACISGYMGTMCVISFYSN